VDTRSGSAVVTGSQDDPRERRRAARVASNRGDILDAAERVFAEKGPASGSLRDIAHASGFSTAAIYNYFENKQDLLDATIVRRSTELYDSMRTTVGDLDEPLAKLHGLVDASIEFFERYPDFRRLLRHGPATDEVLGSTIAELANNNADLLTQILDLITGVITEGQRAHQIRAGDPYALTRFYMALVSEHVVLSSGPAGSAGTLTDDEFHDVIEGALRPFRR
jgi:AcrR family transcriptional regulator